MADIETLRWIPAPIAINFSPVAADETRFSEEFDRMAESDEDPVGQWLKLARARGETKESDPVMLQLLVELHRKIDALSARLEEGLPDRLELAHRCDISGVNFTHFRLKEPLLQTGLRYYGRIEMPVFPQREIPLFFQASSEDIGELLMLHERDQRAWDGYVASRERIMIRQLKGKHGSE